MFSDHDIISAFTEVAEIKVKVRYQSLTKENWKNTKEKNYFRR